MSKKAFAFIADGTEEGELINVVDILHRAGVDVKLVSIDGETVTSSHGVRLAADAVISDVDMSEADLLFVPGGMPGSKRLGGCATLIAAIRSALEAGKRVAAICAAPAVVLGANGFLVGKRGICFPGFEADMNGCEVVRGARVVTDGNITTARGLGCAIDLGLELVALLCGADKAEEVKGKIQY
ncbi:MAG: DJ-1/PfpI family protein [Clostridiales bacterium]|nr:DJ-1/PfpI family protein [Clostridiales bacterium]